MMAVNNEIVMEHGQQAVALRDERMAEMQTTINELAEGLKKNAGIIEIRGRTARERFERIQDMSNEAQQKDADHEKVKIELMNKLTI